MQWKNDRLSQILQLQKCLAIFTIYSIHHLLQLQIQNQCMALNSLCIFSI